MQPALNAPLIPVDKRTNGRTLYILLGLIVFSATFALVDEVYVRFVSGVFPSVGTSTALATLYGVVSRLHIAIPLLILAAWRPNLFALQFGSIRQHWRLLLAMLAFNCGVITAYLWLSGGGTPYSDNQWLITEAVTVPLIEELMWRGILLTAMFALLARVDAPVAGHHVAIWSVGIAFGLLHFRNAFFGVPVEFALIQALSAVVWGVLYGYARFKTDSVLPAIGLHASMNLIVVLF